MPGLRKVKTDAIDAFQLGELYYRNEDTYVIETLHYLIDYFLLLFLTLYVFMY
ncbi:hypothetical protein [Fictibacillus enclensis]|uniref:hypothetical protein n=1 Tax=Fictibacillus enclensis TaxID=1017270 RepID=UPI000AA35DD3|nr:hypothetical protein [Fictibacillus enclensis]